MLPSDGGDRGRCPGQEWEGEKLDPQQNTHTLPSTHTRGEGRGGTHTHTHTPQSTAVASGWLRKQAADGKKLGQHRPPPKKTTQKRTHKLRPSSIYSRVSRVGIPTSLSKPGCWVSPLWHWFGAEKSTIAMHNPQCSPQHCSAMMMMKINEEEGTTLHN